MSEEINAVDANSASLSMNNLRHGIERDADLLQEYIAEFAERFGERRVEKSEQGSSTVNLDMSPEGYRTVAALLRVDALRRNGLAVEREDGLQVDSSLAEDNLKIARLFDKAAEAKERELSEV